NIFAVAFDQNGPVGSLVREAHTVRIKKERLAQVQREGLTYELTTPVRNSGLFQVRVIVQDAATQEIGSVAQLVEVPDIANGRLNLTGLIVSGRNVATPTAIDTPESPATTEPADARPAVRRFRTGMEIDYAFLAMNQQLDPTTHELRLSARVIIYRDGVVAYSGPERRLDAKDVDGKRLIVRGQINLGAQLIPGEYVLQVIVTDEL